MECLLSTGPTLSSFYLSYFLLMGQDWQQHPAVHSVGKLAGGGSVAVAVGVSDM